MSRNQWAAIIAGCEYPQGDYPVWALAAADRVMAAIPQHNAEVLSQEIKERDYRFDCRVGRVLKS